MFCCMTDSRFPAVAMVLCASVSWPLTAAAEQAPPQADPGVTERELQQLDPNRFRLTPDLDLQIPEAPPMEAVPDTEIQVERFVFSGNTVKDDAELAALIDDARGTISFRELVEASERISQAYRDAGYVVARAYIPEQTIEDGEVEIAVLEGYVGVVEVKGDPPLGSERAVRRMDRLMETGIINQPDLERGALLLNDLPGMSAGVSLRPGEEPGTTDVVIEPRDERWWDLSLDYNNFGAEATGEHRFGLQAQLNNLFGIGDRLSLRPIVSDTGDTFFGTIGFDAPAFTPATRLGVSFSHLDSDLGDEFDDLDIENTATTAKVHGEHAWIRSRERNLNSRLAFEHRRFERESLFDLGSQSIPIDEVDYNLNILELGASGDLRDNRLGGGINNAQLALRVGLSDVDAEDGGATFDGEFVALHLGVERLQRITPGMSLNVRLDGQFSDDRLDSSERISLGGPNAVRAYRSSEALGDSGVVVQSELRHQIPWLSERSDWVSQVEGYALLDAGVSDLNEVEDDDTRSRNTRSAYGGGLRVRGADHYYVDLAVATRLARRSSLVDQPDDDSTRFWAQAVYWF